jgi:hypothetical protein
MVGPDHQQPRRRVHQEPAVFSHMENNMTNSKGVSVHTQPSSDGVVKQPAFPLGQVVATPGALQLLELHGVDVFDLLRRHASGTDWGDVGPADRKANHDALIYGDRVLSVYTLVPSDPAIKLFCITEWDRSVTTVLKPSEY